MITDLDNLEYKKRWHDFYIDYRESYSTNMGNFHMHDYYEISVILSGKVKVLLSESASEGENCRLVLTSPNTPHFVACDESVLYRRLNILFAPQFIENYSAEFSSLLSVFGKNGRVISVATEQCEKYVEIAEKIKNETNSTRQKLISLYLLSLISETIKDEPPSEAPPYVTAALRYINEHYSEKIVASELAWKLGIGRTTLMTAFKRYTGSTLQEHILRYRLSKAIKLLSNGQTEQAAAESCGFNDSCTLIRSFKKIFGQTPAQYMKQQKK
jgi:AraC-like DNA-binding protein